MFSISAQQDHFELQAGRWCRRFEFSSFGAATSAMRFGDQELTLAPQAADEPECFYDGLTRLYYYRRYDPWVPLMLQRVEQADPYSLRAMWCEENQGLQFTREWQVFPELEAWVTRAEIQSEAAPQLEFGRGDYRNVIETLPLALTGWRATVVRFYGRTDRHNEMLAEDEFIIEAGATARGLRGNLLFLEAPQGDWGLFVLHEAPPAGEERPECEWNFLVGSHGVSVQGWGVAPHEVLHDRPLSSYSVGVGVYEGGRTGRLEALRRYLKVRFPLLPPERAIVANPWGDGRCIKNLSEQFILQELEACAELGITHYQIDDGWQAGGVLSDMVVHNWARDEKYWQIHPEKFPRGFEPLAQRARELGVELALWFAPDANRHYRNWAQDRDILLDFHRRYGINLIKIDAVWLRTKAAEDNLCRLLREVQQASGGRVRFNLDVTAGRRLGYFANLEFGSLFIENRYVTSAAEPAKVYAPHRTLCNFWNLAHYVPPEKTQFEVPNIANLLDSLRDETDPLNPMHYRWDYIAAITLFSSPLIWCEPSQLPPEARAAWKPIIELHHRIREELYSRYTFPIGDEPNGHTWTGFQSYQDSDPRRGLLLVFRECNEESSGQFALHHLAPHDTVQLECLSHTELIATQTADSNERLMVQIPQPRDFRLYRYEIGV